MIPVTGGTRLFLFRGRADMRKGFDGLAGMVEAHFSESLFSGALFIFVNHRRNRIKMLYWDSGGLALSKAKRRGINKRLRYFRTHQARMQYHLYRREGWPIGSGEVEGACKSLIKQRTDLSGQRWSPDGALNVLWVRALVNDRLHDRYWNTPRSRSRHKQAA